MEIKIEGNPGTGNSFTEVNIQHVENYNPNATTVTNNYYSTCEQRDEEKGMKNETKDCGQSTLLNSMKEPEENIDITPIRTEILSYVSRVRPLLADDWKKRYMKIWEDILGLNVVENVVYQSGKQQGTNFNRNLVANIIHYLDGRGAYKEKYSASEMARALEGDKDHSVRGALGNDPALEIVSRLNRYFE